MEMICEFRLPFTQAVNRLVSHVNGKQPVSPA